jgi:hypothetical protein
MNKRLNHLIDQHSNARSIDDLPTDAQVLFGFLALIVDIKYRNKYGKPFEEQRGKGYSEQVQSNKVLADQVSPVDDGLLGINQRELFGL